MSAPDKRKAVPGEQAAFQNSRNNRTEFSEPGAIRQRAIHPLCCTTCCGFPPICFVVWPKCPLNMGE